MNERMESIAAKIYEDAFATKGIWLPCEFPPEAEGVYQRRHEDIPGVMWQLWDGKQWLYAAASSQLAESISRQYGPSRIQSGEYLLPAGSWAVTKEVRPPLPPGTMVYGRAIGCTGGTSEPHKVDSYGNWHNWTHFRLAPALKPKCEHVWSASGHACDTCGANRQSYEATFIKSKAAQEVPVTARSGAGSPKRSDCTAATSVKSPVASPPAAVPFLPYRDKRFGLLVRWPESRSRTVPKECPVNVWREWQ